MRKYGIGTYFEENNNGRLYICLFLGKSLLRFAWDGCTRYYYETLKLVFQKPPYSKNLFRYIMPPVDEETIIHHFKDFTCRNWFVSKLEEQLDAFYEVDAIDMVFEVLGEFYESIPTKEDPENHPYGNTTWIEVKKFIEYVQEKFTE